MKYLRTYEKITEKRVGVRQYWGVNTDSAYFVKSLEKIGCPENMIKTFVQEVDADREYFNINPDTTFIACVTYYENETWYISPEGSAFANNGYEYMGSPKFTKEEVKQIELEKDANKYNV